MSAEIDRWEPMRFLLGEWEGAGSGEPGEGTGAYSLFSLELGGSILVRKSRSDFAPLPGEEAGISHEDLLVVYRQPWDEDFKAIYFDAEGHVINYRLHFPWEDAVVFESDPAAPGPCFRLDYELLEDGGLSVAFSIALPGQALKTHVSGVQRRMEKA